MVSRLVKGYLLGLGIAGIALASAGTAMAAGIEGPAQSVSSMGNAFAGVGAIADDASTNAYNPASITLIKHPELVAGIAADYNKHVFNPTGGTSVTSKRWLWSPDVHFVAPIGHKFAFGMSVTKPFSTHSDYTVGGLNFGYGVNVVRLNPNVAYRINDRFSIGAGVMADHMDLDAQVAAAVAGGAGTVALDNEDWAYGWDVGALFQLNPKTRFGFAYHSKVSHDVKGTISGSGLGGTVVLPEPAGIKMATPADWLLSGYYDINHQWSVMGNVKFTQWSQFRELVHATSRIPGFSNVTLNLQPRNTWSLGAGVNYRLDQEWLFRGGFGWEEGAFTTPQSRNPFFPDGNQWRIGLGAHFQATQRIGFDVAWDHYFIQKTSISSASNVGGLVPVGNIKNYRDILGASMTWNIV